MSEVEPSSVTPKSLVWCDRIDGLTRRVANGTAWLTVAMVLVAAINAVLRYAGRAAGANLSSNAWLELQWYLFSLVFLLGGPHALRRGGHVRVDVLLERTSTRVRAWVDLLGGLLLLIPFCLLALATSWAFVADSVATMEQSPDPGGLPRWPIKVIVPLAFVLLLMQAIAEVLRRLAVLRGTPPAIALPDEEADS